MAGICEDRTREAVITQLIQRGVDMARFEAKRYAGDFGRDKGEKLRFFAESLVDKMLQGPVTFLKNAPGETHNARRLGAAELVRRMFYNL